MNFSETSFFVWFSSFFSCLYVCMYARMFVCMFFFVQVWCMISNTIKLAITLFYSAYVDKNSIHYEIGCTALVYDIDAMQTSCLFVLLDHTTVASRIPTFRRCIHFYIYWL